MDTEDFIGLPDCNDPETALQDEELHNSSHEPQGDDSRPSCSDTGTSGENGGYLVNVEGDSEKEDGQLVVEEDPDKDLINNKYISPDQVLSETDLQDEELHNSGYEHQGDDSQSICSDIGPSRENGGYLENIESDSEKEDGQLVVEVDPDKDLINNKSISPDQVLSETVVVAETMNHMSSKAPNENDCLTSQDKNPASNHKREGNSVTGVKRDRRTFEEGHASVHVVFNSLTRDSKKKLEELLQQWSEWHALHVSTSKDPDGVLESGEQTFFPALHVGLEKFSAVSFWMDNGTGKPDSKEIIRLDGASVPLYDRGYAFGLGSVDGNNLEGGLEILVASRCFNCNSYNHTLKDCPKPRDNVAVNNARKQHKSKRNQATGSRNPIRYYQNTPGGKYDGLRPGALDADTRKLLGLGEFDPPPWLNRMREIGYPPGYLDPEDEDQPSGIMIYGDEESKREQEDGEILSDSAEPAPVPEPRKKMSVKFPGINAPIPENADQRLWAEVVSGSDLSRIQSHRRFKPSSESSRTHFHEQKRSMDYRDDGPPGVDPGVSPSSSLPRYDSHDSQCSYHSPRDYDHVSRTPTYRSFSERGRRSPLVHEDSPSHGSYRSRSYSSERRHSPWSHGSTDLGTLLDDRRIDRDLDYASRRDHRDHHYHRY